MGDAFFRGALLGLFSEAHLHPGIGLADEVIDLPVSREATTGFPQITETALKGALKRWAGGREELDRQRLFGKEADDGAGELIPSTGRLLCLPVRRLDAPYAWVTTPYLLERLARDRARFLGEEEVQTDCPVRPCEIRCGYSNDYVFLEEFAFERDDTDWPEKLERIWHLIQPVLPTGTFTERLKKQLAVMSDEDFAWFAANALPVAPRNKLSEEKISESLWYEEMIPSDALFYLGFIPRFALIPDTHQRSRWDAFCAAVDDTYVQVGGNETVGQGWLRTRLLEAAR